MAFKPVAGAICACLAVVSINVNALLIDNGSYTTDIDAELDWLDASYTIGKNYYEASAGFNTYLDRGWRYATVAEVDNIFSKLFDGYYDTNAYGSSVSTQSPYADQLTDVHAFQSLFGFVERDESSSSGWINRMTYGRYADDYIRTGFGFGFSPVYTIGTYEAVCAATNTCSDARGTFAPGETYTTVYGTERTANGYAGTADPVIFTFAVRDHCTGECVRPVYVPEPSTAWLIGTGLLVIWMTRHGKAA